MKIDHDFNTFTRTCGKHSTGVDVIETFKPECGRVELLSDEEN